MSFQLLFFHYGTYATIHLTAVTQHLSVWLTVRECSQTIYVVCISGYSIFTLLPTSPSSVTFCITSQLHLCLHLSSDAAAGIQLVHYIIMCMSPLQAQPNSMSFRVLRHHTKHDHVINHFTAHHSYT